MQSRHDLTSYRSTSFRTLRRLLQDSTNEPNVQICTYNVIRVTEVPRNSEAKRHCRSWKTWDGEDGF